MIDTNRKSADINQLSNNSSGPGSVDAAYATLRAFAEQNGVEQPPSTAGLSKLADADSLLDFLRQGGSSAKPSVAPQKGPVAGGTQPSAPVDATYVGAKVCTTCHASQAELFSHTLMGRIEQTQKGKFDCENCHGPRVGPRKGRWRARRRRNHLFPAKGSIAYRGGEQCDLPRLPRAR